MSANSIFIDNDLIFKLKEVIERTNSIKRQAGGARHKKQRHVKSDNSSSISSNRAIPSASTISSSGALASTSTISSSGALASATTISSASQKHSKKNLNSTSSNSIIHTNKKSKHISQPEISSESSFFTENKSAKEKKGSKKPSTTLSDISSDSVSSPSFGQQGGSLNRKHEKKMVAELTKVLND